MISRGYETDSGQSRSDRDKISSLLSSTGTPYCWEIKWVGSRILDWYRWPVFIYLFF